MHPARFLESTFAAISDTAAGARVLGLLIGGPAAGWWHLSGEMVISISGTAIVELSAAMMPASTAQHSAKNGTDTKTNDGRTGVEIA